ncbi:Queuosine precursor transporter [Zhongshania aliphaticivorans]|uniref:Probable queuosine precursor transporter n=1 Tax=Zhongshania aliphaticivorans TaxID=1470434 RepID=A0A5S9Q495_9GAMM|nr:queuosine precursor transporter [Zhongshania aliphaticivorans]CAA0094521.1 Queuosine precursor transporter [Zhongshania aliphaticivorans]CAA0112540.1 Queuosine precursor transporter [Zhongshania aliphaticivorans]
MQSSVLGNKATRLFVVLGGFFVANAILAELIGVKIFSLENSLGIPPLELNIFGIDKLSFNLTTGVLLWPFVFVLTDLINEYYGKRGVRLLSYLTAGLIIYAFAMVFIGIHLVPADFWPQSHINANLSIAEQTQLRSEVGDYNAAFGLVFGQGLWIIIGSLIAFLVGQIIDIKVFQRVKKITGESMIWLRATGSTLVSQFIDSFVVLFIAFYIGADWSLQLVLAIGLVNYIYKFMMAILMTPLLYAVHFIIEQYLGNETASAMKHRALKE